MEPTKNVGVFIRVSTDGQVKDESPEHHEERARFYCKAKGWNVLEVYNLGGVSGKSVMQHSETQRMLKDIRRRHITALVFSKLARLARSTKELLEFADIFRAEGADLVSLSENIDTSTPAGRLFFTIISAMAEWEREEIASRVAASVPVRARMGKSTGGQASFGYKWEGQQLVIDETEAPVRKLMYELFLKHQRKSSTADELNALGYRTRNGAEFSNTTVLRLLRDSTAKGERRANYTKSLGKGKEWILKPESDWIVTPCPPIISPELWNEVNQLLDIQEAKGRPQGPKAVHLLSGFVQCACGKTMYVFTGSANYKCKDCKRSVAIDDIDEIYQTYLHDFLTQTTHSDFTLEADTVIKEKQHLLSVTSIERNKLAKQLNTYLEMRVNGELTPERFAEHYKPLEARIAQLDASIPELQAEIDFRSIQLLSSDAVLTEAKQLSDEWPTMPFAQKRAIVETITEKLVIDNEDITIKLSYAPALFPNSIKSEHNHTGSYSPPT